MEKKQIPLFFKNINRNHYDQTLKLFFSGLQQAREKNETKITGINSFVFQSFYTMLKNVPKGKFTNNYIMNLNFKAIFDHFNLNRRTKAMLNNYIKTFKNIHSSKVFEKMLTKCKNKNYDPFVIASTIYNYLNQLLKNSKKDKISGFSDNTVPFLDLKQANKDNKNINNTVDTMNKCSYILADDELREILGFSREKGIAAESIGIRKLIDKYKIDQIDKLFLATKFGFAMQQKARASNFEPKMPPDKVRIENLKDIEDITKGLPHQFALPKELLYKKIRDKSLQIFRNVQKIKKSPAILILLDKSSSMSGLRNIIASALSLGITRFAKANEIPIIFAPFHSNIAYTNNSIDQSYQQIANNILDTVFDGGGTNIQKCLSEAIQYLRKIESRIFTITNTYIYILTDGEDEIKTKEIINIKGNTKLFSVLIIGSNITLQNASDIYYLLSSTDINSNNIIQISDTAKYIKS